MQCSLGPGLGRVGHDELIDDVGIIVDPRNRRLPASRGQWFEQKEGSEQANENEVIFHGKIISQAERVGIPRDEREADAIAHGTLCPIASQILHLLMKGTDLEIPRLQKILKDAGFLSKN